MKRYHTSFKFLNCFTKHPDYLGTLADNWKIRKLGKPMYVVWKKLNKIQPILNNLNKKITVGGKQIQDNRDKLEKVQTLLNGDMFNNSYLEEVKHRIEEVTRTTELDEQMLQQKSKLTWLKLGDGKNSFFYATVQGKNKRTGIYKLEDGKGKTMTGFQDIEQEVITFYED